MARSEMSQGYVLACLNTATELVQNVTDDDDEQIALRTPGDTCGPKPDNNIPSGDGCANPLKDPQKRWTDDRLVYIKALVEVAQLAIESMPSGHVFNIKSS